MYCIAPYFYVPLNVSKHSLKSASNQVLLFSIFSRSVCNWRVCVVVYSVTNRIRCVIRRERKKQDESSHLSLHLYTIFSLLYKRSSTASNVVRSWGKRSRVEIGKGRTGSWKSRELLLPHPLFPSLTKGRRKKIFSERSSKVSKWGEEGVTGNKGKDELRKSRERWTKEMRKVEDTNRREKIKKWKNESREE